MPDLPQPLQLQVDRGSNRDSSQQDDIICLTKKFISSSSLAQKPLLVMTRLQAQNIPNVPTEKHPLRSVSASVKKDWGKLATAVENFYGDSYKPAALYLRRLLSDFFYQGAQLEHLSWMIQDGSRFAGEPRFQLHKCVLDTLAPSQPLRAVWSRR